MTKLDSQTARRLAIMRRINARMRDDVVENDPESIATRAALVRARSLRNSMSGKIVGMIAARDELIRKIRIYEAVEDEALAEVNRLRRLGVPFTNV